MKRKLGLVLMLVFLLNIMPSTFITEVLGLISEVKAETTKPLTREDVKKFKGRIAAGDNHTAVLNADGTVWAVGADIDEQLNVENWTDIVQVTTGGCQTIGLKSDGTIVSVGQNDYEQLNWTDIVEITSNSNFLVGLKSDGTVVTSYGRNTGEWKDIVQISSANNNIIGLKSNGTVVVDGSYQDSKINLDAWSEIVQVSTSFNHTVGLKSDGTVVAAGDNSYGQLNVESWTDIVQISTWGSYTVGLKSDGTVLLAGKNENIKINLENWSNIVQVGVGVGNVFGLKSDGTIVADGYNFYGEMNIDYWNNLIDISAGSLHAVGLKPDGTVVARGTTLLNNYGQVSLNDWKGIVEVSEGWGHTVGLKSDRTVVASGYNGFGQINVESWTDIIDVSAGENHTVGLMSDGTVVGVGDNRDGQLNVESWTDIVNVVAGRYNTLGVKDDGTVVNAGRGGYGVNSWNNIVQAVQFKDNTVGLKNNGTIVYDGVEQLNFEEWTDIVQISAKTYISYDTTAHVVGLKSDGTVVATGNNDYGQLNVQSWTGVVKIIAGPKYTLGLKGDGTIVFTGYNSSVFNSSEPTVLSKMIYKQGDVGKITIKKEDLFYTYTNPVAEINGQIYELKQINEKEYEVNYICNTSGEVNVKVIGAKDSFNNDLVKEKLFKVIPLKTITTNKTQVANGEKITITATFTEPIQNNFTLELSGATYAKGITLKEIPGTNGLKYAASYIIPNSAQSGEVDITIKNLTDNNGVYYNSYTEKNVFNKIALSPPVESIELTNTQYKIGDYIAGYVRFNKDIDYTKVRVDLSGAINIKDLAPGKGGLGGVGFQYYINGYNNSTDGPVTITVKNIYDATTGVLYGDYVQTDACNVYGLKPKVTNFKASTSTAKLGDVIRFTATFNKAVQNSFNLSLNGQFNIGNVAMTEVENSKGTEYYYDYKVTENDLGQINQVSLTGFQDLYGNYGDSYYNNSLVCIVDGQSANVTNIEMDSTDYVKGDIAALSITLNEPIKEGVKATLLDGENILTVVNLEPVQGGSNKSFEAYFLVETGYSCNVDIVLSNIEDIVGNKTDYRKESVFKITGDNKPIIVGVDDITLLVGQDFDTIKGVTASDNEDGDITSSIIVEGDVDVNTVGVYELVYSVTDSYGNTTKATSVVTVRTNEKPIITGADDITIVQDDSFDPMAGVTASDFEDGEITKDVVISGAVDISKYGEYTLTYSITDSDNNTTTVERVVTVLPKLIEINNIPTINGTQDITIKVGDSLTNADLLNGVTAIDKEDGDLTSSIVITSEVDTNKVGSYVVTYEVTDSKGAKAIKSIVVTVRSNEKPVITGADDLILEYGQDFDKSIGITATDFEDGDLTDKITVVGEVNTNKPGEYKISYTVVDSDGNTTEIKRTVTVKHAKEDVNKDGVVDALDLALIGLSYNTNANDHNWNVDADINKDNIIDIFDIVYVSRKM